MHEDNVYSVGLDGDGDEIAAIDDIERVFGVKLDYSDAYAFRYGCGSLAWF